MHNKLKPLKYIHLKYYDKIKDSLEGTSHLSGAVTIEVTVSQEVEMIKREKDA